MAADAQGKGRVAGVYPPGKDVCDTDARVVPSGVHLDDQQISARLRVGFDDMLKKRRAKIKKHWLKKRRRRNRYKTKVGKAK